MLNVFFEFMAIAFILVSILLLFLMKRRNLFLQKKLLLAMEQADKYYHLSMTDQLTGLPNRVYFRHRLDEELETARQEERTMALMYVDFDLFKQVNDAYGHHIGDEVLNAAANRLQSSLQAEDFVARMGGDEFTVILTEISHPDDAARAAQKIIDTFSLPVKNCGENYEVQLTASIGISLYPLDGFQGQTLLEQADLAMYQIKQLGGNNYRFYKSPDHL